MTDSQRALNTSPADPTRGSGEMDTYTPCLWVTLNDDAKYEEYIRVRLELTALQQTHDALLVTLREKEAQWREVARRVRPLEDAPLTAEKRARIAEWMHYTKCADELRLLLTRAGSLHGREARQS